MIGAFVMGVVGSLHCVGMCGPLNLLMLSSSRSYTSYFLYHAGRVTSYLLLGLVLGLIGHSFQLFKLQQAVTFTLGVTLFALYGIPGVRAKLEKYYYQSALYKVLRRTLSKNFSSRKRWFLSGAANGLLPCGLTYVAAAGSVVAGTTAKGVAFMLLFGLGTLPGLLLLSIGVTTSGFLRTMVPKAIPFIAILSGGILLLRGFLISYPNFNQLVQAKAVGLITVCGL
ncbi:MAG: sulfite exporter TauE/SafE family protein [Bacteroidota bacterium]